MSELLIFTHFLRKLKVLRLQEFMIQPGLWTVRKPYT